MDITALRTTGLLAIIITTTIPQNLNILWSYDIDDHIE